MSSYSISGKALSLETTENVVYKPASGDRDIFSSTDDMMHSCTNEPPMLTENTLRSVRVDHSDARFVPKQIEKPTPVVPVKKPVKTEVTYLWFTLLQCSLY